MGQDRSEITEQVVKFPPKQQSGNPADEAGKASQQISPKAYSRFTPIRNL
jgi:hypothetical protein